VRQAVSAAWITIPFGDGAVYFCKSNRALVELGGGRVRFAKLGDIVSESSHLLGVELFITLVSGCGTAANATKESCDKS